MKDGEVLGPLCGRERIEMNALPCSRACKDVRPGSCSCEGVPVKSYSFFFEHRPTCRVMRFLPVRLSSVWKFVLSLKAFRKRAVSRTTLVETIQNQM